MGERSYGGGGLGRGEPLHLHPDEDLAPNRPGEALHAELAAADTSAGRWVGRLAGQLLGRPDPVARWRRELAGQQLVGAELEELTGGGWRVLHSVPLPSSGTLPHLLTGPGGVFALHTAHHPGARLQVGVRAAGSQPGAVDGDLVHIQPGRRGLGWGRGGTEPYVRLARRAAHTAGLVLARGCGFPVEVRPVLVLPGAARVAVAPELDGVTVLEVPGIARLGRESATYRPDTVELLHGVARDRRSWSGL